MKFVFVNNKDMSGYHVSQVLAHAMQLRARLCCAILRPGDHTHLKKTVSKIEEVLLHDNIEVGPLATMRDVLGCLEQNGESGEWGYERRVLQEMAAETRHHMSRRSVLFHLCTKMK